MIRGILGSLVRARWLVRRVFDRSPGDRDGLVVDTSRGRLVGVGRTLGER